MSSRPRVTVAIDLGSTFCGYAYSINHEKIKMNDPWVPDSGSQHSKTQTALLYDENMRLKHFGFNATSNISNRCNHFFRFFKKSAEDTQTFSLTSMFENQSGIEKNTLDLYADVLRKLKNHCLERIENTELGEKPLLHEVLWILPVPIIWPFEERDFMIAAAKQAGLISEMKATNLMLLLEGDAAFAFCQELNPRLDLAARLSNLNIRRLAASEGILVIDAGGKTVDATTKWIQTGNNTGFIHSEKLHPSGFSAGGENINKAFEELMQKILGKEFITHLKERKLTLWIKFMTEFEIKKKNFSKDKEHILLSDACVSNFESEYNRWAKTESRDKTLAEVLESDSNGLEFEGGQLRISKKVVVELFDDTVSTITAFISREIDRREEDKAIEAVYLAGGFGSCVYLQEKVRETVGERAVVVIPKNPEQAVLRGAIFYSRSRQCIDTYRVDANYGVSTKEFRNNPDSSLHPHLLGKGTTIIRGNTYHSTIYRDELEDENVVTIYRNSENFLDFPLEAQPNITRDRRPSVKVYLQMINLQNDKHALQATVIDGITQVCFIKRKLIPSFYNDTLAHLDTRWKTLAGVVLMVAIFLVLFSNPMNMIFVAAIVYLLYDKFIRR